MLYLTSLIRISSSLCLWALLFPEAVAAVLALMYKTLTVFAPLFVGVIAWSFANYLAERRFADQAYGQASITWASSAMGLSIVITAWGMLDYFMALGAGQAPDTSKLASVVASTVVGFGYPWFHQYFLVPRMLSLRSADYANR